MLSVDLLWADFLLYKSSVLVNQFATIFSQYLRMVIFNAV